MSEIEAIKNLAGPGGLPEPHDQLLLRGDFTVRSDMAVASGDDPTDVGSVAMSGIKGLLRSALARLSDRPSTVPLFGDSGREGIVIPLALVVTSKTTGDRVVIAVDGETRTVARGAFLQGGVLRAGSTISLYAGVRIPREEDRRSEVLHAVAILTEGLRRHGAKLGVRRSVGRSSLRAREWQMRFLDLSDHHTWMAWHHAHLDEDPESQEPVPYGLSPLFRTLEPAAEVLESLGVQCDALPETRPLVKVDYVVQDRIGECDHAVASTLRIGGPQDPTSNHSAQLTGPDPDDPERWGVLVSGNAVKNHLRRSAHRALLEVAARASGRRARRGAVVHGLELLGESLLGPTPARVGGTPRGSAVHILEEPVVHQAEIRVPRVKLNPLTGGAVDHMLMTYDVTYEARFTVEYECAPLGDEALGVLALALERMMRENAEELGGMSGVGHGRTEVASVSGIIPLTTGDELEFASWKDFQDDPRVATAVKQIYARCRELIRVHEVEEG